MAGASQSDVQVELYAEAPVPSARGEMRFLVFREIPARGGGLIPEPREHVAIVKGDVAGREGVPVRVHSECLTSEVFGSLKCDCKDQLDRALDRIMAAPAGVLVYLRQEGRGIGLGNKIRAYALQAKGRDTYQANRELGFADDLRRYDVAAEILRSLRVGSIDLLTNNPEKLSALKASGIDVRRRLPSLAAVNAHNVGYLRAKREQTGHLIEQLLAG